MEAVFAEAQVNPQRGELGQQLDQRAAVVLRDIEGLRSAEASAVLEIAEPALKTRLHRGRMRLRSILADYAPVAE